MIEVAVWAGLLATGFAFGRLRWRGVPVRVRRLIRRRKVERPAPEPADLCADAVLRQRIINNTADLKERAMSDDLVLQRDLESIAMSYLLAHKKYWRDS